MMFSIWVCSEIGFLETNRVDHHSRLICEPRLLAVLGVCQWIVTTVLKLSHCSRNLGEVWVRAELLWGNVLPSQKSSPFFCMSVPASKTLRACRMNFRFYMWTTSHALQTRPIPWIAPACFFFFLGGLRYCPSIWKRRSLWQLAFFRPAGAELTVHIYTCCRLFRVGNRMSATGACSACPSDSCKLWSDEIWIWMNMMHDAGVYL